MLSGQRLLSVVAIMRPSGLVLARQVSEHQPSNSCTCGAPEAPKCASQATLHDCLIACRPNRDSETMSASRVSESSSVSCVCWRVAGSSSTTGVQAHVQHSVKLDCLCVTYVWGMQESHLGWLEGAGVAVTVQNKF